MGVGSDQAAAHRAITVVVADDSEDIRLLMRLALQSAGDMAVVGEATNATDAVRLAAVHQPDVAILDLNMPEMDVRRTIPELLEAAPLTRVLVISGHDAARAAQGVIDQGAAGYLEKGGTSAEIVAAVRASLASGPGDHP